MLRCYCLPCLIVTLVSWLVGWLVGLLFGSLIWFNAELSPKCTGGGPRSQEVVEEGDSTYRYTVTTRMTPALRWPATRATFMFH